jgi:4-amino-4-deoxy-L-arabinose transferase-like glycosyltransferase
VLAVAAFNLAFRIGNELVQVWDESLFAITAGEMVASNHWIGTTFLGALDYYNSKPPLQVWLVALSFKAFGAGLVSLRLPAMISAWATVALLVWWAHRCFGRAVAVVAGLVLATCYGFLYVHSGRSGNADSLMTLLVLLTVVTLWAARDRPWRRVWLGPIIGLVFMAKGMGILMPSIVIVGVEAGQLRSWRSRLWPHLAAVAAAAAIVAPWAIARWQLDQWRFFDALFFQDFVARASTVLDGHEESFFYYFYFLQKHQYDWLVAAAFAFVCLPNRWTRLRSLVSSADGDRRMATLTLSWFAATFVLPTVAVTKLGWYINSFYPLFALAVAWLLVEAWNATADAYPRRATAIATVAVIAVVVAEAKLAWHSYALLDLHRSAQSLVLSQNAALNGRRIYASEWPYADRFVVRTVHGQCEIAADITEFLAAGGPQDLWLGPPAHDPRVVPIVSTGRQTLYRRADHLNEDHWGGSDLGSLEGAAP